MGGDELFLCFKLLNEQIDYIFMLRNFWGYISKISFSFLSKKSSSFSEHCLKSRSGNFYFIFFFFRLVKELCIIIIVCYNNCNHWSNVTNINFASNFNCKFHYLLYNEFLVINSIKFIALNSLKLTSLVS